MAQISERDAAGNGPDDLTVSLLRPAWLDVQDAFPDRLDRLAAVKAATEWFEIRQRMAVSDARTAGKTWQEIGDALGITRQAAQKRYGYMG